MADSTIDSEDFVLHAKSWGAYPVANMDVPLGGFTNSDTHAVATEEFPLGTMVQVYNDGSAGVKGLSQLMYLKVGTQNASVAIAAKTICVRDSSTNPFVVTNDPDDCLHLPAGECAIALSAMDDDDYGWFWVGGVCPEAFVSDLGGNYVTDGNVVAGPMTIHDLSADKIGFGPAMDPTGSSTNLTEPVCGDAQAADAA